MPANSKKSVCICPSCDAKLSREDTKGAALIVCPKCGQSFSLPALVGEKMPATVETRKIPQRVGKYEIKRKLGQGGMGVVYLGIDEALGRDVAIKVLPASLAEQKERLERFRREARLVARMSHPGIVPVYDSGVHEGSPYFVMEYVKGKTLDQLLHDETLSPGRCLEIAGDVARALRYAHERGVVHRDLKPSNLIVEEGEDRVRILDFGLSKPLYEASELTRSGDFIGTPRYVAPEQISETRAQVDARTDLYVLGVILYELLTGRPAFQGDTLLRILRAVETTTPPPPSTVNKEVPTGFDRFCQRAMAKKPDQRFQSAEEFMEALQQLAGQREEARPGSRAPAARHRALLAGAAGLLLVVAAIILLVVLQRNDDSPGDAGPAADRETNGSSTPEQPPADDKFLRALTGEVEAARRLVSEDRIAQRHSRLLDCRRRLTELIREAPCGRAYEGRGLTHLLLGAFSQAKEDFSQALRHEDGDKAAQALRFVEAAYYAGPLLTSADTEAYWLKIDAWTELSELDWGGLLSHFPEEEATPGRSLIEAIRLATSGRVREALEKVNGLAVPAPHAVDHQVLRVNWHILLEEFDKVEAIVRAADEADPLYPALLCLEAHATGADEEDEALHRGYRALLESAMMQGASERPLWLALLHQDRWEFSRACDEAARAAELAPTPRNLSWAASYALLSWASASPVTGPPEEELRRWLWKIPGDVEQTGPVASCLLTRAILKVLLGEAVGAREELLRAADRYPFICLREDTGQAGDWLREAREGGPWLDAILVQLQLWFGRISEADRKLAELLPALRSEELPDLDEEGRANLLRWLLVCQATVRCAQERSEEAGRLLEEALELGYTVRQVEQEEAFYRLVETDYLQELLNRYRARDGSDDH